MNFKTPALIAALALTASASFAAPNSSMDDLKTLETQATALSAQLETMGVDASSNVEFNSPTSLSQKIDAYEDKIDELQGLYNATRNAN